MRGLSAILMVALALAPVSVVAQTPDELATIERLYDEGRALYETADYDGAIAKWTEAYSLLGASQAGADIRSTLLYNLASAHEAAFDIDGDVTHLTKAKVLLERFEGSIDQLYEGDAIAVERERVVERLAGIEAKLATDRGATEPAPTTEPGEPEQQGLSGDPVVEPDPEGDAQPEPTVDKPRANKPLLIGGSVALVLGLGGLGAGVAGLINAQGANDFADDALDITPDSLAIRHDQIRFGQQMNVLSYAGFLAGGVLVITGATLLGLSVRAKSKSRPVAAVPALGPSHAGLLVRGSF